MRIARIETRGRARYASVEPDGYRPMQGSPFRGGQPGAELLPLEGPGAPRLLAPVRPPQIAAIGLNYRRHAAEGGRPLPEAPLLFVKTCNTVIGPGEPIVLPAMAPGEVDYEAELAVVIGRRARNVSAQEAADYVLGYTCGNDVSARDCQHRLDKQWARGKCFDSFCPLGPWIETELDPANAGVRLTLNGRLMQDSNTRDMVFPCLELVSYVSRCMTLEPGSIIMTGTPEGVGYARQPPVFLRAGDRVSVEIEGIGTLANSVQAADAG